MYFEILLTHDSHQCYEKKTRKRTHFNPNFLSQAIEDPNNQRATDITTFTMGKCRESDNSYYLNQIHRHAKISLGSAVQYGREEGVKILLPYTLSQQTRTRVQWEPGPEGQPQ